MAKITNRTLQAHVEASEETTKDDRLIGRVGLIASMNQSGHLSDEDAAQRVRWLMDEYRQEESPVDVLKRIFGGK